MQIKLKKIRVEKRSLNLASRSLMAHENDCMIFLPFEKKGKNGSKDCLQY